MQMLHLQWVIQAGAILTENRVHIIWKGRLAISRTSLQAIRKDPETFPDRITILQSPGKQLRPKTHNLYLSTFLMFVWYFIWNIHNHKYCLLYQSLGLLKNSISQKIIYYNT